MTVAAIVCALAFSLLCFAAAVSMTEADTATAGRVRAILFSGINVLSVLYLAFLR